MAILTPDLDEVIWANGPGAALFGFSDIESIIGAEPQMGFAAKRQIMATSGYPRIGKDRAITVRLASGMTSRAVAFVASEIALPDGEEAILLAVPAAAGVVAQRRRDGGARHRRARPGRPVRGDRRCRGRRRCRLAGLRRASE